jgi:hypothetical protein
MSREARLLTVTSLLALLFASFHLADDVVRGFEPGGVNNYTGVIIMVVWMYATLMLAERRSGYVIMLLGSLLGAAVPLIHMRGAGLVGGRVAHSSGMFFWVWTHLALGATALFSFILSARELWRLGYPQRRVRSQGG